MNSASSPLSELPAVGFLTDVPADHRAFLTGFGKFLRPHNGDILIAEGTNQESLSLVLEGTLHVVTSLTSHPMLLATVGAGDSLGEINLFDPAVASATVIARSECLIWSMTRGELEGLIDADPTAGLSVMRGLLRQLSKRIRQMNEKLSDAAGLGASFGPTRSPQP
jgi:CRP-like cAMP-binding protein